MTDKPIIERDILLDIVTDDEARDLLSKFFDGKTSLVEELLLYSYFAKGQIASDLQPYAGMMNWYAQGCPPVVRAPGKSSRLAHLWQWCGAAAIAFLVFSAGWQTGTGNNRLRHTEMLYSGSYAMIDGERVTDLSRVLVAMEQERLSNLRLTKNQLRMMNHSNEGDSLVSAILADILND